MSNQETAATKVASLLENKTHYKGMLFSTGKRPNIYIGLTLPWMRSLAREHFPKVRISYKVEGPGLILATVFNGEEILATGLGHCSPEMRDSRIRLRESLSPMELAETPEQSEIRQARTWAERDALTQLGLDLPESFRIGLLDSEFKEKVLAHIEVPGRNEALVALGASQLPAEAPRPFNRDTPVSAKVGEESATPAAPAVRPLPPEVDTSAVEASRFQAIRGALEANGYLPEVLDKMSNAQVDEAWAKLRGQNQGVKPPKAEAVQAISDGLNYVKQLRALMEKGNSQAALFFAHVQSMNPDYTRSDEEIAGLFPGPKLKMRVNAALQENAKGKS